MKARIAPRETTEAVIENSIKLDDNLRLTDGGAAAPVFTIAGSGTSKFCENFREFLASASVVPKTFCRLDRKPCRCRSNQSLRGALSLPPQGIESLRPRR
jgi:hypothetical protein